MDKAAETSSARAEAPARRVDPIYLFRPPRQHLARIWPRIRTILNHFGAGFMAVATGGYAWLSAPYQVEYTQISMPLPNLPASFEGFRIIQITDLHACRGTPLPFLQRIIDKVNSMECDLVVVTGDLVTSRIEHVEAATDLVAKIRHRTLITFGNHDYSPDGLPWNSDVISHALERSLKDRGLTVLRDQAISIDHEDGRVWIVGMEDFWSLKFNPERAFAGIPDDEPIIALSHNPDSVFALEQAGAHWVVSGHTHGGQIRLPVLGPIVLPMEHKQFAIGQFQLGRTKMYVARGVGFRLPVRFRCPPEVPSFILSRERGKESR